jgi:hypothetical protein
MGCNRLGSTATENVAIGMRMGCYYMHGPSIATENAWHAPSMMWPCYRAGLSTVRHKNCYRAFASLGQDAAPEHACNLLVCSALGSASQRRMATRVMRNRSAALLHTVVLTISMAALLIASSLFAHQLFTSNHGACSNLTISPLFMSTF